MPSAVEMAREFGDDLAVIFVGGGRSKASIDKFVSEKGWRASPAMWTKESPLNPGVKGISRFALLGADGTMIQKGRPITRKAKIVKAIEAEIRKGYRVPESAPGALRAAHIALSKGRYSKAYGKAEAIAAKGGPHADAAEDFCENVMGRVETEIARVNWLVEQGQVECAAGVVKDLIAGADGLEPVKDEIAELEALSKSADFKTDVKLAKDLNRLEAKLHSSWPDPKLLKRVAKFALRHPESVVGERAARIVALAEK